eukprot:1143177-Pelagomonas_calceolata.AAC.1
MQQLACSKIKGQAASAGATVSPTDLASQARSLFLWLSCNSVSALSEGSVEVHVQRLVHEVLENN